MQVTAGTAMIATSGSVTSGPKTTPVVLPHRGVLRVCASSAVKLSADASIPASENPGLMIALDRGAVEASFATGTNSDVLLTPDFRILIGAPGSADLKVRLGDHGDTCVDNAGKDAPYVLVTSVFDGGAYRVQPGQRVMFQHGSLQEVVDQEQEPCGCPPEPRPNSNDFPLAESAGLAPLTAPPPPASAAVTPGPVNHAPVNAPLVYQAQQQEAPPPAPPAASTPPSTTPAQAAPAVAASPKAPTGKSGIFHRIGRFFRKVFGAD